MREWQDAIEQRWQAIESKLQRLQAIDVSSTSCSSTEAEEPFRSDGGCSLVQHRNICEVLEPDGLDMWFAEGFAESFRSDVGCQTQYSIPPRDNCIPFILAAATTAATSAAVATAVTATTSSAATADAQAGTSHTIDIIQKLSEDFSAKKSALHAKFAWKSALDSDHLDAGADLTSSVTVAVSKLEALATASAKAGA